MAFDLSQINFMHYGCQDKFKFSVCFKSNYKRNNHDVKFNNVTHISYSKKFMYS